MALKKSIRPRAGVTDEARRQISSHGGAVVQFDGEFGRPIPLRELKLKAVFEPSPEIIGAHAFAVCDSRRLFVGGYDYKNQLFWRDEASKRQFEFAAVDETGEPINWNRVYGRGADLFLCNDARVRMLSLQEIGF